MCQQKMPIGELHPEHGSRQHIPHDRFGSDAVFLGHETRAQIDCAHPENQQRKVAPSRRDWRRPPLIALKNLKFNTLLY